MAGTQLLSDCRVLDITQDYNAYASKLLSDLGADVIKVEPPDGEPAREVPPFKENDESRETSAFFGYLNTGKRSIALDPEAGADRQFLEDLVRSVDLVFEDHLAGYELAPASAAGDRLGGDAPVVVSLSTFGRGSDREGAPLLDAATGGLMYQSGYKHRPPTAPGLSLATYLGVSQGAVAALLALQEDNPAGRHLDVSRKEPIVSNLEATYTEYTYNGRITERNGNTHPVGHPMGEIYPTADGAICLCLLGKETKGPLGGGDLSMWPDFCRLIDREDLLEDERFNATADEHVAGFTKRLQNADQLDEVLKEELKNWEAEELFHESQANGISNALVSTPDDLFTSAQLEARDYFTETALPNGTSLTMPTAPYRFSAAEHRQDRAPRVDEHGEEIRREVRISENSVPATAANGRVRPTDGESDQSVPAIDSDHSEAKPVLDGIRVLDFSIAWAGPYCARILANHGADVIKVESSTQPDATRTITPLYEDRPGDPVNGEDRSGAFQEKNLGKRCLGINLATDEGVDLVKEMVADGGVDVIIESFAPGTFERMDLGYETLRELNEDLIMVSVSGYGQEGPESDYRAYGAMLGPHAGIAHVTGFPDDEPVRPGIAYVDPATGLHAATAVLSALRDRERGGPGQYIDFSMREVGVSLIHQALSTYQITGNDWSRQGNRDPLGRALQGCYRCAEDDSEGEPWVAIVIRGQADWRALCDVLGNPDWTNLPAFADQAARRQHHDELDEHIESWTENRSRYEVADALQSVGVPAGVVQTTADILERDDHLRKREFWWDVSHPVIGTKPYPAPQPPRADGVGELAPGPMIGQHSKEVLFELLGASGGDIAQLEDDGVLD